MGVDTCVVCLDCLELGPAIGTDVLLGIPKIEAERYYDNAWGATYCSFGWIYEALEAIDLIPY